MVLGGGDGTGVCRRLLDSFDIGLLARPLFFLTRPFFFERPFFFPRNCGVGLGVVVDKLGVGEGCSEGSSVEGAGVAPTDVGVGVGA